MTNTTSKPTKTPVALDAELKDWLKHKAIDNKRTLQQEIAVRLKQTRTLEEMQQGATA